MNDTPPPDAQAIAERAAAAMFADDRASQSLGMRIVAIGPDECRIAMTVRADMVNGVGTCHGGILFTLADSAFAFACNSDGATTVAAGASIDFLSVARAGDELTATARALWRGRRAGLYDVSVVDQRGVVVATFRGRSYRLSERDPRKKEPP